MMAQFGADAYAHMPETFEMPLEHAAFVRTLASQPGSLWIYKPSVGARGEGIRLVWRADQVRPPQPSPPPLPCCCGRGAASTDRYISVSINAACVCCFRVGWRGVRGACGSAG
jgi:hypothetical protein